MSAISFQHVRLSGAPNYQGMQKWCHVVTSDNTSAALRKKVYESCTNLRRLELGQSGENELPNPLLGYRQELSDLTQCAGMPIIETEAKADGSAFGWFQGEAQHPV